MTADHQPPWLVLKEVDLKSAPPKQFLTYTTESGVKINRVLDPVGNLLTDQASQPWNRPEVIYPKSSNSSSAKPNDGSGT